MIRGVAAPKYARDHPIYDGTPSHGAIQIKDKKKKETTEIIAKIIKAMATKLFSADKEVYIEASPKKEKLINVPPTFQKVSFKLANHNCI